MADFTIKRRDAKTGGKRERTVRRLSAEEVQAGSWARAISGTAHHFFIEGVSICGRQPGSSRYIANARILCPECYASAGRPLAHD